MTNESVIEWASSWVARADKERFAAALRVELDARIKVATAIAEQRGREQAEARIEELEGALLSIDTVPPPTTLRQAESTIRLMRGIARAALAKGGGGG